MLNRSVDRGQVFPIRKRNTGKANRIRRGSSSKTPNKFMVPHGDWNGLQEEVVPAQKLAHHQLPEGEDRWKTVIPIIEELKVKARKLGLWNLFLSKVHYPKHGVPLTNLEV